MTWPDPEEFTITRVNRDREWFARVLPELQKFKDELAAGVPLPSPPKPRAARKRKPQKCAIVSEDEDDGKAGDDDHADPAALSAIGSAIGNEPPAAAPTANASTVFTASAVGSPTGSDVLHTAMLNVYKDILSEEVEGRRRVDSEDEDGHKLQI